MATQHRDSAPDPGRDHLDDLRAQLPAPYRQAPGSQVAGLWVAWSAARHGHDVAYLEDVLGLPPPVAEGLVAHARRAHPR
ncbi:hypothetical protein [Georgenia ruanii]|uniref:hypothetical protein n=1 Tax=Georgenia ruanii TaxID=348442 RepID=UPI0012640157|nr:hypothetical protein [Georgenia ruanii]